MTMQLKPPSRFFILSSLAASALGTSTMASAAFLDDSKASGPTGDLPPTKVPDEAFYVLGDNRQTKQDSRTFGPITQ